MLKLINLNIPDLCINLLVICLFFSCKNTPAKQEVVQSDTTLIIASKERFADTLLTPETRALWINLKQLRGKGFLFGHQDATIMGVNSSIEENLSDVKAITGTYPALYGWEIAGMGSNMNIDSIPFALIIKRMTEAFNRGGVNTVTWHLNNPVTGGTSWDVFPAVKEILPDSSRFEYYKTQLKEIAVFFNKLKTTEGTLIPVIFRPFHENNGNWFWWGRRHCTPDEYIKLWRFTVTYLRDSLNVHNLLYAYSPDLFETSQQYLERYPGDEWVDIMGCENYWDFQSGSTISNGIARLRMLVEMASQHKKLAAITECGFSGIPIRNWWTQYLLIPIKKDSLTRNISYLMVWRNVNRKHYYVPFAGQKSAADFRLFEQDTFTYFERDLDNMYVVRDEGQVENNW
jgi:mannan endo-1,4-beta-mannosidase